MSEPLIDNEGENMAVRRFLMQYGVPGLTVGAMKRHLDNCGHPHWPAWVDDAEGEHLTKVGAQLWLRHLFALEPTSAAGATNSNELTSSPEPAPALRAAEWVKRGLELADDFALKHALHVQGRATFAAVADAREALHAHLSRASGLLPVAREGLSDEQLTRIEVALEAGAIWAKHSEAHPRINSVLAEVRAYRQSVAVAPASGDAPGEAK